MPKYLPDSSDYEQAVTYAQKIALFDKASQDVLNSKKYISNPANTNIEKLITDDYEFGYEKFKKLLDAIRKDPNLNDDLKIEFLSKIKEIYISLKEFNLQNKLVVASIDLTIKRLSGESVLYLNQNKRGFDDDDEIVTKKTKLK